MFNHRSLCDVAIRIAIVGILAFWHTPVAAQLPEGIGPQEKALIEELDGAAKLDATGRVSGIAFNRGATNSVFIRLGIMESVTALDLQFSSVTDEGLVHLRNFPSLRRLVAPVAMTDKGLASIAEHCPHLEELDVSFTKITDAGMPSIAKLTALRTLYLTATDVGDVGMAYVVACQHLRCLGAPQAMTDRGLEFVAQLTAVEVLALNGTEVKGPGLAHLADLPKLSWLNLYNAPIDDKGLRALQDCHSLTWLDLIRTRVSDAGMKYLARMPKLQELSLPSTISDTGFAALRDSKCLRSLKASRTGITDAGIPYLLAHELESLGLVDTNTTDAGIRHLAEMRSLRYLSLHGTRTSHEAAVVLGNQLPNIISIEDAEGRAIRRREE